MTRSSLLLLLFAALPSSSQEKRYKDTAGTYRKPVPRHLYSLWICAIQISRYAY